MAGEKIIPKYESGAAALKTSPTKLAMRDAESGKKATPSNLTPSMSSTGDATSSIKGEIGQVSVAEQSTYYPPTSYYNYSYPGYNGTFAQVDEYNYSDAGGGSYAGFQTDNSSLMYYLPGYDPYTSGSFMGLDGQQPYYSSPGYSQQPVSFGPEALQGYSWNSTYFGDATNGTSGLPAKSKSALGNNGSVKSNSFKSIKPSGSVANRSSMLPFDPKSGKSAVLSNISKATIEKTWGKMGAGYQTASAVKGYPFGKYSSFINQSQGLALHNSPVNYRPNSRGWNGNSNTILRDRNGDLDASTELTCGPRVHSGSNPLNPPQEEHVGPVVQRDKYNREEFQTEYENAKFFIIKSYSEDDVHKCIKYDVWSSTPNGNRKLNSAYQDAEAIANETGKRPPVFLFFSVNGSGQFIGVAEMIGLVDFHKDMDFWQLDKWNGFFPLKWHIIKDIPNSHLRHIILENNDNRPVTYSRDTQEVGLKQGVEMLKIFKSFSVQTSILDDFNFYDNREKSLRAKRNSKQALSQMELVEQRLAMKGERTSEAAAGSNGSVDPTPSLIKLTRNLSLSSRPLKNGAVANPSENSVPSVAAANSETF